jgi:hypothetical protein
LSASTDPAVDWRLWDDELWDDLLGYIEDRNVIPIVGPCCYQIESDGRRMTVERYVAEQLAAKYHLHFDDPTKITLNEVMVQYLRQPGSDRQRPYRAIKEIVEKAAFDPPDTLIQLASITQFNLFVSTSFDPLLEQALNRVRFGGEPRTQTLAYSAKDPKDISTLERPTVYLLLGRMSNTNTYAVADDDILEFMVSLQSSESRPARLFDELRDKCLLLLGADFPDWLSRVFLRTAKGARLSDVQTLEILADSRSMRDASLLEYLASFSRKTKVFRGTAPDFVGELFRRWRERFPDEGVARASIPVPLPEMPTRAIFISYARDDLGSVHNLVRKLLSAGVEFWFDLSANEANERRLLPGDDWDKKISSNIQRCALFLPVLSKHTESRLEGYFRREWRAAADRGRSIAEGVRFIVPIVVDDTKEFQFIPKEFQAAHISWIKDGMADDAFVQLLKTTVERR